MHRPCRRRAPGSTRPAGAGRRGRPAATLSRQLPGSSCVPGSRAEGVTGAARAGLTSLSSNLSRWPGAASRIAGTAADLVTSWASARWPQRRCPAHGAYRAGPLSSAGSMGRTVLTGPVHCRPPAAWDRHFASGMGPGRARFSVAVVDDYGWFGGGSRAVRPPVAWDQGQLSGQPAGEARDGAGAAASSRSGIPLGWPGFSGAARVCPEGRAERALAVPGVLGQALLPGREDAPRRFAPRASLREGRGCGGSAPAVCCWQHG